MKMETDKEQKLFDLLGAVKFLWEGRLVLLVGTSLSTAAAIAIALLAQPSYEAEVVMLPATEESSGLSSLGGQLGGLAALAGVNLGAGAKAELSETLAVLNSRRFLKKLIQTKKMLPKLFPAFWDANSERWLVSNQSDIPTVSDGYELLKSAYEVSIDKKTRTISLFVRWGDPDQAAEWANEIIVNLNDELRELSIKESENSIRYLNDQLQETEVAELQVSIYRLVEGQLKSIMLAKSREHFALKVVDPAEPPEYPVKPRKRLMVMVGFLLGLMLSTLGLASYRCFVIFRVDGHQAE